MHSPKPALPPLPGDARAEVLVLDGVEYVVLSHPVETTGSVFDALSDAEREIVGRIVEGWSCARIGAARGTSPRTVEKQLQAVYRKVGVGSRAGLVARLSEARTSFASELARGTRRG